MIWGVIGGILLSLLASELYASCPWLTTALLKRAKRALPEEYQDRYWEEWLGELDAQRDFGNLKKLGWALGVFLSSGRTAKTLHNAIGQGRHVTSPQSQLYNLEDEKFFSYLRERDAFDNIFKLFWVILRGSWSVKARFFITSSKVLIEETREASATIRRRNRR